MKPHVLLAVANFTDRHVDQVAAVTDGWATFEAAEIKGLWDDALAEKYDKATHSAGLPKPEMLLKPNIRFHQLWSAGWDRYQGKGLEEKPDFIMANGSGTMAVPVAEQAIAMLMALVRRLPEHMRDQTNRRWERYFPYNELLGSTACVIGIGAIGSLIVSRLKAFDMRVTAVRRDPSQGHPGVDVVYGYDRLIDAVAEADHIILALPGGADTRHLFNADVIGAMKPSAFLINIARGSIIDDEALIAALREKRIGGAGLDAFVKEPLPSDSPYWDLENVLITPHTGGLSLRVVDRVVDLFCENLIRYRDRQPLKNVVVQNP
jgi:phosphoglycerate dehydrogenase-like enzyme